MAMAPEAQSALIEWVNTFPLDFKVESAEDLSDGYVLSKILAEIDSTYMRNVPAQANTLQRVVKGLSLYIRTECEGLDSLLEGPGLRAIAEKGRGGTVFEVLPVMLMAAVMGPHRETHVLSITKLDEDVQGEIAKIIQQKQQEVENAASASFDNQPELAGKLGNDYELEFEVRYSALIAQKKALEQERERLRKQMADMATRLERLQDNNDHLQESLTAAEDKIQGAARDRDAADMIKGLEAKIRDQDELIANQEGQFEQDRVEKTRMRRDVERLKSTSDQAVQLQDENKELRFQNTELTKKANTLDRYKQKLESQRDFQTDIKTLELDNEELQMRVKDFELLKHRNEVLEATHLQFQNTLARREMEIFELSSQKKTLDEEKADLQRTIIRLEEIRAADEGHIAELQEQFVERPQVVASPSGPSLGSLEAELEQSASGTRTSLEVSRLRAENQLLKGNASAAQDAAALRIQLEEEERIRKREEQKYNDLFEKHVIASQQVTAILEASTAEGLVKGVNAAMLVGKLEMLTPEYYSSEAFANLRKSYLSTNEKLSAAEKRIYELEGELESTKRELLVVQNDLSMIAQEDLDALQELKATQESLAVSTEMELKKLQSRHKDLQIDYEQQKSQLIEALLSKDKLQQSMTESNRKGSGSADESIDTKQMKEILNKTSSELKLSQEVSHASISQASEELARERVLLGYAPSNRSSLRPEEIELPESPEFPHQDDHQDGCISPNLTPSLHLKSLSSPEDDENSGIPKRPADYQRLKAIPNWKFWKRPAPPHGQLHQQDSVIRDLNIRINDLESGGPDAEKIALEQELSNMRRETSLIVSAWYDLTSRLQMDNVGLQRRQDAPKSWMNKQRQAVNAFGRR